MKQNNSDNETVKWIILIVVSVGIGTFISSILENIRMNIWLTRAMGALVTGVAAALLYPLLTKILKNKHTI